MKKLFNLIGKITKVVSYAENVFKYAEAVKIAMRHLKQADEEIRSLMNSKPIEIIKVKDNEE